MRRGQPVGALATSSDGRGFVSDPLTTCPVQVPFQPCVLCVYAGALRRLPLRSCSRTFGPFNWAGYALDAFGVSSRGRCVSGDALRVGGGRLLDGDRRGVPRLGVAIPEALPPLMAGRSSSFGGARIRSGLVCAMGGRSTALGEAFLTERRIGPWALSSTQKRAAIPIRAERASTSLPACRMVAMVSGSYPAASKARAPAKSGSGVQPTTTSPSHHASNRPAPNGTAEMTTEWPCVRSGCAIFLMAQTISSGHGCG